MSAKPRPRHPAGGYPIGKLSRLSGVSRWLIRRAIEHGELEAVEIAGVYRIPAAEAERFLAQTAALREAPDQQ